MKIHYSWDRIKFPRPNRQQFKEILSKACEFTGATKLYPNKLASFSFVGPRVMGRVNEDYVGHSGVTDVISFNYSESDDFLDEEEVMVEIIVCVDVALKEGNERENTDYQEELVLYIVHGLLHTVGEDDLSDEPRKQMRIREQEVMTQLKLEFDFNKIINL